MSSTFKQIPPIDGESTGDGITAILPADSGITVSQTGDTVSIGLDPSFIQAQEAASVVGKFIAGETISALQAVYYDSSTNTILKGNKNTLVSASIIGVTKTSGNPGDEIEVLQYGILTDPLFSYSPAQLLFLDHAGIITPTAPASGYLTRVGRAITSNTILVLIESSIAL